MLNLPILLHFSRIYLLMFFHDASLNYFKAFAGSLIFFNYSGLVKSRFKQDQNIPRANVGILQTDALKTGRWRLGDL
jgi:hypothetical protein